MAPLVASIRAPQAPQAPQFHLAVATTSPSRRHNFTCRRRNSATTSPACGAASPQLPQLQLGFRSVHPAGASDRRNVARTRVCGSAGVQMSLERELANANSFHVGKHTGQSVAKFSRPRSPVTDSRSSDMGATLGDTGRDTGRHWARHWATWARHWATLGRHRVALGVIGQCWVALSTARGSENHEPARV